MAGLALAILLQASAPDPSPDKLDCAPGYEATLARVRLTPGATASPASAGAPFGVIEHRDTTTLYTYTLPGAVGHPAVVKRQFVRIDGRLDLVMSACGWGDKAGFDRLMKQFNELNAQMKASLAK